MFSSNFSFMDMDLSIPKDMLFSEPNSVLDLGPHISPLNSPNPSELSLSSSAGFPFDNCVSFEDIPCTEFQQEPVHRDLPTDVYAPISSFSTDVCASDQEHLESLGNFLLSTDEDEHEHKSVEEGVEIVNMLLACVENIQKGNLEISRLILDTLDNLNITGTPLERVARYISEALSIRIDGRHTSVEGTSEMYRNAQTAFYTHFPFLRFVHFTANKCILDKVKHRSRIHIVDLDIQQGFQWPNFIQVLASIQPAVSLRITGVGNDRQELHATGRRLTEFASLVGFKTFEFRGVDHEELNESVFLSQAEEALAVNCSMYLHKLLSNRGRLNWTLEVIRRSNPDIVTVCEVEGNNNTPCFADRFVEVLHFYSAVFDCIESTLPREDLERLCIESVLFGSEIRNVLTCDGDERVVRHLVSGDWRECMRWSGFKDVALRDQALYQAHLFLTMYPPAYKLSKDGHALILGWHDTPFVSVSTWSC